MLCLKLVYFYLVFYYCCLSVSTPCSSVISITVTLFTTFSTVFSLLWTSSKSVVFSSIQEIWNTAVPFGYKFWIYPFPCCLNPVTKWCCSRLLCFPCGVSICLPAKSHSKYKYFRWSLKGLVCSLHQAPAVLTSFLIPYDHNFFVLHSWH